MSDSENRIPEDLKKAAKSFAECRRESGGRLRYPQFLIDQARTLLSKYSMAMVGETLGVSLATLQRWKPKEAKRVRRRGGKRPVSEANRSVDFIEIPPIPFSNQSVEVCLKNGLIIRLPSTVSPAFLAETCKLL